MVPSCMSSLRLGVTVLTVGSDPAAMSDSSAPEVVVPRGTSSVAHADVRSV